MVQIPVVSVRPYRWVTCSPAPAILARVFGKSFVDYYLRIKEAEIARYQSEVTEWEHREYFELF